MKIHLLTHAKEITKKTNTGRLAIEHLPELCERTLWDRVHPDPVIETLASKPSAALLFPIAELPEDYCDPVAIDGVEDFVILDGTWQQARKMYNQSPYLKQMQKLGLAVARPSEFRRRRNQKQEGLCTAETVCQVLREKGRGAQADSLYNIFQVFNLQQAG